MKNVVATSETIMIGREAYFFLREEERKQRGCKPLTPESEERIWNRITKRDGLYQCTNDSFGGGDGTYNGRWWSWPVATVKKMLDEAGLEYQEGETVEFIRVYI